MQVQVIIFLSIIGWIFLYSLVYYSLYVSKPNQMIEIDPTKDTPFEMNHINSISRKTTLFSVTTDPFVSKSCKSIIASISKTTLHTNIIIYLRNNNKTKFFQTVKYLFSCDYVFLSV
jgi:hypothetical protein